MNSTTKRLARATPLANGAPYYEAAGWPWWIPIIRGGLLDKQPRVNGHSGEFGEPPTYIDRRIWPQKFGKSNIALVLQRNVIGLDVDHYDGKRGGDTKARLERELGPLPSAPISTSRWPDDKVSGIRLYRVPGYYANYRDWPTTAGKWIDLICWFNRYVIVPPSIHASGRQYRWIRDGEPLREMMTPRSLNLLPSAWCEYLAGEASGGGRGDKLPPSGGTRDWLTRLGGGQMCPYMADLVPEAIGALPGTAHEAARYWTLMMCNAMAMGHPGGNRALWKLRDAFFAEVGARSGTARRSVSVLTREWRALMDGAVAKANANGVYAGDPCTELEGL